MCFKPLNRSPSIGYSITVATCVIWQDAPQPLVARLIKINIFNLGTIVLLYTSALSLGARRALESCTVVRTSFKSTYRRSIPICHQQELKGEKEPSQLLCLALQSQILGIFARRGGGMLILAGL
jgi:hypothetical protein